MSRTLRYRLGLSLDRLALRLAKRTHELLDAADEAKLQRAVQLFQVLADWELARRRLPDGALDGPMKEAEPADERRAAEETAAERLAGLIAELPGGLDSGSLAHRPANGDLTREH